MARRPGRPWIFDVCRGEPRTEICWKDCAPATRSRPRPCSTDTRNGSTIDPGEVLRPSPAAGRGRHHAVGVYAFFQGRRTGATTSRRGRAVAPPAGDRPEQDPHQGAFHRAAKRDVRVTCGWDDTDAVRHALAPRSGRADPLHEIDRGRSVGTDASSSTGNCRVAVAGFGSRRSPGDRAVEADRRALLQSCRGNSAKC